jgi:hypothetical protein
LTAKAEAEPYKQRLAFGCGLPDQHHDPRAGAARTARSAPGCSTLIPSG